MTVRVLLGNDIAVTSPVFVGADGESPTDCDSAPTVTVTRDDGTALTAPTVTDPTVGDGAYSAAFLHGTHTSRLDLLTVTWTGVVGGATQVYTDTVEVVGGFYVTLNDLRNLSGLSDTAKFPTAVLRELRDEFQDTAERYCGQAFVPRYQRDVLHGRSSGQLLLTMQYPRTLVAVTATDNNGTVTTMSVTNWRLEQWGVLVTDGDVLPFAVNGAPNITVEYTHGLDSPPPPIVQACKQYVRSKALEQGSRIGRDLLSSISPEGLNERWSTPDWDAGRPTGLLDVDRALNSIGRRAPGIA